MLHPAIKLLATRPDLLTDHLAGYGQLIAAQAGEAADELRVRLWLTLAATVCAALAALLAGVAAMLAAAIALPTMPAPWVLVVLPSGFAVLALMFALALRRRPLTWSLQALRLQWAADAALLKAVRES